MQLGQNVVIKANGLSGTIEAIYLRRETSDQFSVRYVAADNIVRDEWFFARELDAPEAATPTA